MYEDNTFLIDVLRSDLGSLQSQVLMYCNIVRINVYIEGKSSIYTGGYNTPGKAIWEVPGCSKCGAPQLTIKIEIIQDKYLHIQTS